MIKAACVKTFYIAHRKNGVKKYLSNTSSTAILYRNELKDKLNLIYRHGDQSRIIQIFLTLYKMEGKSTGSRLVASRNDSHYQKEQKYEKANYNYPIRMHAACVTLIKAA